MHSYYDLQKFWQQHAQNLENKHVYMSVLKLFITFELFSRLVAIDLIQFRNKHWKLGCFFSLEVFEAFLQLKAVLCLVSPFPSTKEKECFIIQMLIQNTT